MSALAPTPTDRLTDARGRPYFVWDEDLTLEGLRERLRASDAEVRTYFLGKLMRQAKPDDVFTFVTLREVNHELEAVGRHLGRTKPFWTWLISYWRGTADGARQIATPLSYRALRDATDTPHQILVNELCALLGRSEPRDLDDVHVLLDSGGDLARALRDCPQQDAGFSPLTLAWTVQSLPFVRLVTARGWSPERIETVSKFRRALVEEVLRQARPAE